MSSERLVVAIDTSTDMLACAVARVTDAIGGERMTIDVLATGDHMCRRQANVELVSTIDAALADAGRSRGEVDAYLVGRGPGSFTGVRIGISTAKGLARGANVPCTVRPRSMPAHGLRGVRVCAACWALRPMRCAARYTLRSTSLTRLARTACSTVSASSRRPLRLRNGRRAQMRRACSLRAMGLNAMGPGSTRRV